MAGLEELYKDKIKSKNNHKTKMEQYKIEVCNNKNNSEEMKMIKNQKNQGTGPEGLLSAAQEQALCIQVVTWIEHRRPNKVVMEKKKKIFIN